MNALLRRPLRRLASLALPLLLAGGAAPLAVAAAPAVASQDPHDHAHGHAHDPAAPRRTEAWSEDTLKLFATIPVQDGGRVKPLDTLAQFKLLKLNGKRSTPTGGHAPEEKLGPVAWLLDALFFPEQARDYPCFLVRNRDALIAVGLDLPDKKKSDRYSYHELVPAREKLFQQAQTVAHKDSKDRSATENEILIVANNVSDFERVTHFLDFATHRFPLTATEGLRAVYGESPGAGLTPVLRGIDDLLAHWRGLEGRPEAEREAEAAAANALMGQLQFFLEVGSSGLAIFPPAVGADERAAWVSPVELVEHAFKGDLPIEPKIDLLADLEALVPLATDPAAFETRLASLHAGLQRLAEERGEYAKIPLEVAFYRWDFFTNALVFYLLGFLLVAVSWLGVGGRWIGWGIWGSTIVATLLAVAGITIRCILRDRPPVSTLYETILFIAACAAITCLVIEWINRQRIALATATVLGALGMFLSMKYELKEAVTAGDTMPSLVAVLDTNFWLATHVTTVTLGYAAGLLAAAIAHVWILGKLFGLKRGDKAFYKSVARMTYGVICFGLLFSVVGTILGGIWANYSWGRFWGWDPKENGALLICLMELLILHARMGGYIKDHGLALLAVLNGIVVAFSWWGVNLLSVGLHSYGFTTGVATFLFGFYAIEGLVILAGAIAWLVQRMVARERVAAAGAGSAAAGAGASTEAWGSDAATSSERGNA